MVIDKYIYKSVQIPQNYAAIKMLPHGEARQPTGFLIDRKVKSSPAGLSEYCVLPASPEYSYSVFLPTQSLNPQGGVNVSHQNAHPQAATPYQNPVGC